VTHGEATGDILGEPTEVPPHTLSDGFQGLEARGPRTRMDADTFGREMIYRDEHRGLTFPGERGRQIRPPHGVHRLGNDGAIVVARSAR